MNKRKVLSILLLALITVSLAVSCSSNIDTPAANSEELAYVTFGNGHSRELGTSYETLPYNSLYWFYTATKDDSYGTTGETSAEKPVTATYNEQGAINAINMGLSGRVGPFSQGKWIFTLKAYAGKLNENGVSVPDTNKLVYEGTTSNVILKGGDVKNVPVSVSTQGSYGYVKFKDAYFRWLESTDTPAGQGGGEAAPQMEITLTKTGGTTITNEIVLTKEKVGDNNRFKVQDGLSIKQSENNENIPEGFYTAKVIVYLKQEALGNNVAIDNKGTPIFSQEFGLRVYGNATTYISGDMVEGVDSYVTFDVADQAMRVFSVNTNEATTVTANITALNGNKESSGSAAKENERTTVSFPAGALDKTAVHQLDVKVTPTASAEQKFQASGKLDGKTAVSGIDLTMVKVEEKNGSLTQTPVTSFGQEADGITPRKVTIKTYIATGLSNVTVKYLNDGGLSDTGISDIEYNPVSGLLTFKTTHFSQYVVVASVEALNVNTGVPYTSLVTAISDANDGQEVKLMKDVNLSSHINISNNIVLDLNDKKITCSDTIAILVTGNLIISNGNVEVKNTSKNNSVILLEENAQVIINDGTYTNNKDCTIRVTDDSKLIINGGDYNAQEVTVLVVDNGKAVINGGTFTSKDNFVIGTNGNPTDKSYDITINGGIFNGNITSNGYIACGIYMANRGAVTLNGGTFNINGGVGVLVRSGELTANAVTFNITSKEGLESGKVGDAQINIMTPAPIVIDTKANYPGGAPVIAVNKTSYVPKTLDGIDVVTIKTKEELKKFATDVNNSNKGVESTVLLMADIDLQGETWTPIGPNADCNNKFKGVFHGQNHVIKNMTVDQSTVAEYQAAGFFGALNGTAMNLIFENANVSSLSAPNVEGNTDNGTAVVAGSIYQSGLIKNVTVKNSSVSANRYVGGIAGYAYGSVKNCTVDGLTLTVTPDNLHNNKYDNGDKAGGIVGAFWNENTYEISGNTSKNVTITGYRDLGGIAGFANGNVKNNTVDELTINQDYSILSEPKTTVEAIIGRHDGFVVDSSNKSSNVTINSSNSTT